MPKADVVVRAPVSGKNDAQPGFSLLSAWLKSCSVEDESCVLHLTSGRIRKVLPFFRKVQRRESRAVPNFKAFWRTWSSFAFYKHWVTGWVALGGPLPSKMPIFNGRPRLGKELTAENWIQKGWNWLRIHTLASDCRVQVSVFPSAFVQQPWPWAYHLINLLKHWFPHP